MDGELFFLNHMADKLTEFLEKALPFRKQNPLRNYVKLPDDNDFDGYRIHCNDLIFSVN